MNASTESCPICGAPAHSEETDARYCKHAVLSGYIGEVDDENAMEWFPHALDQDDLKSRLMKESTELTDRLSRLVEMVDELAEEAADADTFWRSIESRLSKTLLRAFSQAVYHKNGLADRIDYTFAVLDEDAQSAGNVLFESEGFGLGWAWYVFFSHDAQQAGTHLLHVLASDNQIIAETIDRLAGDASRSA